MHIFGRKPSRGPIPPLPRHQPNDGKRGVRSVLNADILISGNVATTTEIHIDGHVLGDVNCGTLTQSGKGKIVGIVTADTARLAGSIQGTVRVRQLTVESGARINGDITYEQIAIEDGGLTRHKRNRNASHVLTFRALNEGSAIIFRRLIREVGIWRATSAGRCW